jgi:hypothetical protein
MEGGVMSVIETERLTRFYGAHRGIVEVDLSVEQGEAHGFLGLRVTGSMAPVVEAAAGHGLVDFETREPSLEQTFLAQYGREAVEVDGHVR